LANYNPVLASVRRLLDYVGLSARKITLSTVGIVPGIKKLSGEKLPVNLAVSLHAANDTLRSQLVPINKKYPIDMLIEACREYLEKTNRRISFEWALIKDVNDSERDALELADLALSLTPSAHVNLIPLNPTSGGEVLHFSPSPLRQIQNFYSTLSGLGVNATIRRTRGQDIDAACGQLSARISLSRRSDY
jgi:23S rRNA (adenine2503-C2)-methyltransferase